MLKDRKKYWAVLLASLFLASCNQTQETAEDESSTQATAQSSSAADTTSSDKENASAESENGLKAIEEYAKKVREQIGTFFVTAPLNMYITPKESSNILNRQNLYSGFVCMNFDDAYLYNSTPDELLS